MGNLKNVIYLSAADYATLVTTGSVVIGTDTLTYDADNLYLTPDDSISGVSSVNGSQGAVLVTLATATSTATGRIAYVDAASLSHTAASITGSDTFVKSINGGSGSFTPVSKYIHPSTLSVVTNINGGTGSFTPTTRYLTATFNGTSATSGNPGTGGTVDVASSSHTHAVTIQGTGVSLVGTRATSGSGTSARRTLTVEGSTSVLTGTTDVPDSLQTVATSDHTHSVTANGNITLTEGTETSTGAIQYLKTATHSHTAASVSSNENVISALMGTTTAIDNTDILYLESATHSHTAASVNGTATAVTNISGGSFAATDKYLYINTQGD